MIKACLYIFVLISQLAICQNTRQTVIIDSDAGTDDFRAITLLTQLKSIDIKAITLCDGTLFPDKGAVRVSKLLACLNHKNIFIGVGKKTMFTKPVWRSFAENVPWSNCNVSDSIKDFPNATQVINKILDEMPQKSVTFICLGSLSNLYETIMINPSAKDKIKEVIWYNSTNIKQGSNYTFEPKAAEYILSQPIKIKIIAALSGKNINYDTTLINKIQAINNEQASLITKQLHYLSMQSNISHLQCWDELCAAYVANPKIFTFKEIIEHPNIQEIYNYEVEFVKNTLINILKGICKPEFGVVFAQFPTDSTYIQDDVLEIKDQVIQKYGIDEFKAAVLTSEIHNHLGIYSILGAKMGIKAMEILNAPNSSLHIKSFAGNTPPLSCLNDGIMVSTGSTAAYNLLEIDTTSLYPSAIFCYKNKCIQLSLKKEIYEHVSKDLNDAVIKFSLSSDAYWNYVRKQAINDWLDLNRDEIFDFKNISAE